ncbi:MAG: dTDP-4-dehydrorhamnose reductase [Clostridia bacterium]|nr:dTDP-4-dehydrorhamnose reductase [Clostridia bacterium]
MKYLVTGVCGQLGHDVMLEISRRGHKAVGSDVSPAYSGILQDAVAQMPYISLDITDKAAVERVLISQAPDVVLHCAAWTNVDLAEEDVHRQTVFSVNADGTRHIALACKALGCKMIYISTDYVFGGQGDQPFSPDSTDFAPLNVYGQSKLEGEKAVRAALEKYFIVRIAWVFGSNGKNFVKTMLNLGKKYDTLRVVCDQIGTPTYTPDLARLLVDMSETEKYGTYHATNEGGYISWYDFACEIFRQAGISVCTLPVSTAEYGLSKAVRPCNSRLDKSKLKENGFEPLPAWQDALDRYLKETEV